MQRRHFLFLAPLLPSALFAPLLLHARASQTPPQHNLADETLKLNELASNIHTIADARRFIDAIVDLFADELPPTWATESLRARLAQGEYLAVTDPQKRISEEHLAQTWNAYISTIHAPDDSHVSVAEMHNLRDGLFFTARVNWNRGFLNFWSLPSIFATQPDGTLAPACRVVESLRILWDLADIPDNLQAARERVAKGVLTSDIFKQAHQGPPSSSVGGGGYLIARVKNNPVETAENQYIRDHGMVAFSTTVETMLNSLLTV
ncbi:MAG TPA: hypothetical protein VGU25_08560 [Acidobacteriaceae bacterium]|nr:hypothetical protein [Acidobacteriaceae bacterium]